MSSWLLTMLIGLTLLAGLIWWLYRLETKPPTPPQIDWSSIPLGTQQELMRGVIGGELSEVLANLKFVAARLGALVEHLEHEAQRSHDW